MSSKPIITPGLYAATVVTLKKVHFRDAHNDIAKAASWLVNNGLVMQKPNGFGDELVFHERARSVAPLLFPTAPPPPGRDCRGTEFAAYTAAIQARIDGKLRMPQGLPDEPMTPEIKASCEAEASAEASRTTADTELADRLNALNALPPSAEGTPNSRARAELAGDLESRARAALAARGVNLE